MSKVIRQTYQQTQTRKSNSYEKSSHLRGGGGGGRSHGRKRNYDEDDSIEEVKPDGPSYKTARNSKKELCDLGMSCPYIGEYQHRLEFDHQEIETKNSQSKRNSQGHQIPYYGLGNRLGGYDFRSDRIRSNDHRNDNNSSSTTSIKKQKKNNESINYNPVDNLHVICEICHKSVDLFNWDMHALSHERNEREQDTSSIISLVTPIKKSKQIIQKNQFSPRTQLRAEQDQNYEESILEDILKQSKVEYEEYQNSLKHHEVKEDEILNDLLNSTSIHNQPSSSSFRSLKSGLLPSLLEILNTYLLF